ncbi:hypothetical protein ROA7450_00362 [Roseovarius albus]|uniref:Uncharacterized protein n=1 Tax=Roseovarius albus TaxID=1247867 RepID=A0A1X6YAC0_9RHOB|nr:hypothetical protein ROA7450_00362 [Roseovarius albus]
MPRNTAIIRKEPASTLARHFLVEILLIGCALPWMRQRSPEISQPEKALLSSVGVGVKAAQAAALTGFGAQQQCFCLNASIAMLEAGYD